ncbi:MAG: DUF3786 domain-containing protein [Desulfobacterales bacterium]|nr:DUF3786 domain-containing protein [Desulfobacterales bacterium]
MKKPTNAMAIFKLLEKSNCRECGMKTCLAFAGAVYTGQKRFEDCPRVNPLVVKNFYGSDSEPQNAFVEGNDFLTDLKNKIVETDLAVAAKRTGAHFSDNKLTLKVLGKNLSVDNEGKLYSEIHINPWVAVPFLNYVLFGKGLAPKGEWVSFRNLKDGMDHYAIFRKRCEIPMKQIADTYTDLFDDLIHLFNGKQVEKQFKSDVSVVLHPLPKIPVMICYWKPEEDLGSSLNIFFDETADKNLETDAVFTIGVGLAHMFGKLAKRHGLSGGGDTWA